MNGVNVTAAATPAEIVYPCSDGEPLAETEVHVAVILTLFGMLRTWFRRRRRDVFVGANTYLYYREGDPTARKAPDVMVAKGVDTSKPRKSFKTWEERAVPCFILEATSEKTAREDIEEKLKVYQEIGVREYFLFDPLHDYLEKPLMGYRLIGDEYEPLIPSDDGGLLSAELGMRLVPDGPNLIVIHFKTGERLLTHEEMADRLTEAEQEIEQEKQRAEQEKQRAEQEKQRAAALEAELARLRALLPPANGGKP